MEQDKTAIGILVFLLALLVVVGSFSSFALYTFLAKADYTSVWYFIMIPCYTVLVLFSFYGIINLIVGIYKLWRSSMGD